jgi:hypothetical protein
MPHHVVSLLRALSAAGALLLLAPGHAGPANLAAQIKAVVWRLDNLTRIGGHAVTVVGAPRVVGTSSGPAVEFNGATDGLLFDINPLAGLAQFTIEVVFEPASGGPAEQRFLHVEESVTGNRALLETRMLPDGSWCLDTFLRHGDASLTLIDRTVTHPASTWHVAALSFDGRTMTHYVDRVRELSGEVAFKALGPGRTSIGVRQNRVSWFKGRIHTVRITPGALGPDKMLAAPVYRRPIPGGVSATTWLTRAGGHQG